MRRQWPWATNRWCWHACGTHRNLVNSSTRWRCPCNSALSKSSEVWDFCLAKAWNLRVYRFIVGWEFSMVTGVWVVHKCVNGLRSSRMASLVWRILLARVQHSRQSRKTTLKPWRTWNGKTGASVKEVASLLGISVGSAHHIIHDELKFWKVCARWIPKRLTPEMKERRVDACQELMCQYEADGEAFLERIVTGD